MSNRVVGLLLLCAAGSLAIDGHAARVIAGACLGVAGLLLMRGTARCDRLTVAGELSVGAAGRTRLSVVTDPGGQLGRTTILVQGQQEAIASTFRPGTGQALAIPPPSIVIDSFDGTAVVGLLVGHNPVATLNFDPDGWRGLVVRDDQGRARLLAGVDAAGRPAFITRNAEGRETTFG